LQLCDSNELNAQLPFGAGEALIDVPKRLAGEPCEQRAPESGIHLGSSRTPNP
jgi:hypothetical protein